MNKRIVALALMMGCTGAAFAQSTVTIYGRVDLGLTKQNDGTSSLNGGNGLAGAAANRYDLRAGSSSRLGFRGVEDLGGGMKAGFTLEHRFTADNGTAQSATQFWNSRSIVELSDANLGGIYLGRDYVPVYYSADALDPFNGDTVGGLRDRHHFANYQVDGGVRSNNTVGYKSPSWAGLTVQAAVALGEGTRKRATGVNVMYSQGPILAAIGTDRIDGDQNVVFLGGAYDFGMVRPMLSYATAKVAGVKNTNVTIGATAPIGAGRLKAAVARLDPDGSNNNITKGSLGYEYSLSKRTSVYTDLGSAKRQGLTRATAVDLGIKHNF